MPNPRKPRTLDVSLLTPNERKMFTSAFVETLPRMLTFPTRARAFAERLSLYKIIGAGRQSPNTIEAIHAFDIAITQPTPTLSGEWQITLYSRSDTSTNAALSIPGAATIQALVGDLGDDVLASTPSTPAPFTPPALAPTAPMTNVLASLGYTTEPAEPGQAPAEEQEGGPRE